MQEEESSLLIGREEERTELLGAAASRQSAFVVVYGRRRVGKTFLVREAFDYRFTFTHTGLERGGYREQLSEFWNSLKRQWNADCRMPSN